MIRYAFFLAIFGLFSIEAFAGADQCERNFSQEGDFSTGTTYKTWALFENVKHSEAYKKALLYIVKDGWTITASDKEIGIISAAQDVSYGKGKTAPLNIAIEEAGSTGSKVSLTYFTSGGVLSPTEAVKEHCCLTLAEVEK